LGVHVIWVPCRCGCGCGHSCERRYGPYFIYRTRETTIYLGKFAAAIEKLSKIEGLSFDLAKRILHRKALDSALKLKRLGAVLLPPEKRGTHLAQIHGKKTTVRKTRKLSPFEEEFWSNLKILEEQILI